MIDSQDVEQNAPESFKSKRLITLFVSVCFTLVVIGSLLALSGSGNFGQIMRVSHGDDDEIPELDATSKLITETYLTFPEPTVAQPESNQKQTLTQKSTKPDKAISLNKMLDLIIHARCVFSLSDWCPVSSQKKVAMKTQTDEIDSLIYDPLRAENNVEYWDRMYDATFNRIANYSALLCDSHDSECQLCVDCSVQYRFKGLCGNLFHTFKESHVELMDRKKCANFTRDPMYTHNFLNEDDSVTIENYHESGDDGEDSHGHNLD